MYKEFNWIIIELYCNVRLDLMIFMKLCEGHASSGYPNLNILTWRESHVLYVKLRNLN
jgi:hypothetical protein